VDKGGWIVDGGQCTVRVNTFCQDIKCKVNIANKSLANRERDYRVRVIKDSGQWTVDSAQCMCPNLRKQLAKLLYIMVNVPPYLRTLP